MKIEPKYFQEAEPIWVQFSDDLGEPDAQWLRSVQFWAEFEAYSEATLVIAGWTSIRVWVNGQFVFYGPARGPKDHFRVESISLDRHLAKGKNKLAIEVVSYGIPTFSYIHQAPFLQAEVVSNGKVVVATKPEKSSFSAREVVDRRRRVQRYSYMRGFSEAYDLKSTNGTWSTSNRVASTNLAIEKAKGGHLLPRVTPSPNYPRLDPIQIGGGGFQVGPMPTKPKRDRTLDNIGKDVIGWKETEFSVFPWNDWQKLKFSNDNEPSLIEPQFRLSQGQFLKGTFFRDWVGLVDFTWESKTGGTLYIATDEIENGTILNPLRDSCHGLIQIDFGPGQFHFTSAEPIALKYLAVVVIKGEITIPNGQIGPRAFHVIGVQHPVTTFHTSQTDAGLSAVSEAAYQTLLANSFDFFTDCPGRERAGYPCDSFFTSRAAYHVFGSAKVEEAFLENFALAPSYPGIPDGMMPMCYPADVLGGTYIPQWPLWLLVQCGEFKQRSQSQDVIQELKPKFDQLLKWFEPYINELGLLESMPGWNFIEWSGASKLVSGVHFPTNMLYAAASDSYQTLYGPSELAHIKLKSSDAAQIRARIHELSYDGTAYRDHAIRDNGHLVIQPDQSEVCQSFAFFFGLANPQADGALWRAYCEKSGVAKRFVAPNLFIGDILRLELLTRSREYDRAREEIKTLFLPMAEKTGTLWEMEEDWASCCHGFASYLTVIIDRMREL